MCRRARKPAGQDGWLAGSIDEKLDTVAKHLRGFDMVMVETGYRYGELHAAGEDANWGYARYQAEKIRTAIENGLERRPLRAASAETFLTIVLPAVEDAIEREDQALFRERFGALTAACNTCHENEDVAFVNVAPPAPRQAPDAPAVPSPDR